MSVLKETDFSFLGKKITGKVRDIYEQDDKFIFITTDRHSSFDRIIAHTPHKGAVLNLLSSFWFSYLQDIVPNHIISIPDPNVTIAKKCTPLPVECVVRGYITGTTNTSLWYLYENGKRDFGNFVLKDGIQKNQKLNSPVFTPSTKSDEHDETLSPEEIVKQNVLPKDRMDELEKVSLGLYKRGAKHASEKDLILVDTKYEFGLDEDGALTLIDEVHTPDSSRYWKQSSYEDRFTSGKEPEYFDKEFLRLWFKEHSDPYNDKTLPEAPEEMVAELSRRYIEMYETITGTTFEIFTGNHLDRIEKALQPYAI